MCKYFTLSPGGRKGAIGEGFEHESLCNLERGGAVCVTGNPKPKLPRISDTFSIGGLPD